MLWVLKRTVSMRRFLLAPKTYVKTDGQINFTIYDEKLRISKPVAYIAYNMNQNQTAPGS